jgi:hypothetical protein
MAGQHRYKYLVLGRNISYFVKIKNNTDSSKEFSEIDISNMLEFLIDNIFATFGGRVFPAGMLHINGKFTMGKFPHCQLRGVGQSMKRVYLYLLYPCF